VLWLNLPLGRAVPRPISTPLSWVAYIWMGTLVMAMLVTLGADLVRLLSHVATLGRPLDPQRRALVGRALGPGGGGGRLALSGFALFQGVRKVAVKKLAVQLKKLPPGLAGFRVVQITDLHVGPTIDGRWLERVVAQVNALNPDVVAITGDLVDRPVS